MPPKRFEDLSEEQARSYLDRHVAAAEDRLERFLGLVEATGGPDRTILDGGPASLVPLHRWFVTRARRADSPDAGGALPGWYEPDPPALASQRVAPRTIADADGVALYLARVLQRAWPELRWDIGRLPRRMRYAHQHEPLLKAGDVDIPVLSIAYGMGVRVAVMDSGREPEALLDVFRAWMEGRGA